MDSGACFSDEPEVADARTQPHHRNRWAILAAAAIFSLALGGTAAAFAVQGDDGSDPVLRSVPQSDSVAEQCAAETRDKPSTVNALDHVTGDTVAVTTKQWCEVTADASAHAPAGTTPVISVADGELQIRYHVTTRKLVDDPGGGVVAEDHVSAEIDSSSNPPPVPIEG